MFRSGSQHLSVYSPSSTTVSYSVSNALPYSTRSSKLLFKVGIILRLLLCLFVFAVDFVKMQYLFHLDRWITGSGLVQNTGTGRLAAGLAKAVDWRILAAGSFLVVYFCLRKGYTGDHGSTTRSLGYMLILPRGDASRSTRSGGTDIHFFPNLSIHLDYKVYPYDSNSRHRYS